MADRVVKVSLVAQVSNYVAGMKQASAYSTYAGTEAERAARKLATQKQVIESVGKAALTMGTVAAAGVALAVKKYADFDQAMSNVKAATHETAQNMALLREASLDAGARTVFSATEAANAVEELGKAGLSTKDILGGGLNGALDLASAGGLGVAEAAGIAATSLKQFNLQGSDMSHVADLLAAGAGKAMGDVTDLSAALSQSGQVAASTGLSIEETTGTLAAFASAGLLGSDAGTSFKSMLQRLTPQSKEAQKAMDKLGISAYDAQGNFIGMEQFAGNLHDSLKDLTVEQRNSALATIFGSDAVRAATVLYTEGAKGIGDWEEKVNDSGYAAETAAARLDNLKGDIEQLGGALDTALIRSGSGANDVLRGLTQGATTLVTAIGGLPAPVLAVGTGVVALTAGVGLLGGAFLTVVPKIAATRTAMQELNLTGKSVAKGFGKGGAVLLGVTALASAFTNMSSTSELSADKLAKVNDVMDDLSKKKLNELFKDAGTHLVDGTDKADKFKESLNNIASGNFFENQAAPAKWIDGITFGLTHLSDVYKDNEARLKSMGQSLAEVSKTDFPAALDGFKKIADAAGGGKEQYRQLLTTMPEFKAALIEASSAVGGATDDQTILNLAMGKGTEAIFAAQSATRENNAALEAMSGKAQDAEIDIDSLAKTIEGFGSATLDSRSATRAFEAAVDAASDAVKENGKTLDVGTEKGRANQAALDEIASSALSMSGSILEATGSQDKASAAIARGRDELIKALGKFGITGKAAEDYADKLGLIPGNVKTAVDIQTGAAKAKIDEFVRKLNNIPGYREVVINQVVKQTGAAHGVVAAAYNAEGGTIRGPGTGTSDSILSWLSNGEEVTRAAMAEKYRPLLKAINADRVGEYLRGAPAFASGGTVGSGVSAQIERLVSLSNSDSFSSAMRQYFAALAKSAQSALDKAEGRAENAPRGIDRAMDRLSVRADNAAKAVDRASDRLGDLRQSSAQLASGVSSSLRGQVRLSDARLSADGEPANGSSIASFYRTKARSVGSFAGQLKKLAGRGINPGLLSEVAGMGVDEGSKMAEALLSASGAQVKSINSSYAAVGKFADAAGKTVADANFGRQIAVAEKQLRATEAGADKIAAQMRAESARLGRWIRDALRGSGHASGGTVSGPGTGTSDSILSWLSDGEEVTRASMAHKYRPLLKAINDDRVAAYLGSAPRFARGGTVTFVRPAQLGFGPAPATAPGRQVTNNWNITEVQDPVAVAQAVQRRQGMLAV